MLKSTCFRFLSIFTILVSINGFSFNNILAVDDSYYFYDDNSASNDDNSACNYLSNSASIDDNFGSGMYVCFALLFYNIYIFTNFYTLI
jgi:hypothetical protein